MGQPLAGERRPIVSLTPEIVERIAAGEVIERPASALRELIENALDAGATTVRLELRDGGLRLVRVADDGWGIPPDELELAIAPHATSKLSRVADLSSLRTLGFRGEALASIAAVSELHVSSACDAWGAASTITVAAGRVIGRGLDARPRGTTVTVRDLFRDVPARRAALRGPRGEQACALAVARAYALAHPAVRFTAIVDGAILFQTPGASTEEAVEAIYGTDVGRALLRVGPLSLERAEVEGWIASRAFTHADRAHVLLCINGRPVSNRALFAALEAGYRPLLRKGRHPIAVIRLHVEPADLDTNVHPAKAEVLLRSERAIAPALREGVRIALGSAPLHAPSLPLPAGESFTRLHQPALPAGRRRRGLSIAEHRRGYSGWTSADDISELRGPLPDLEPLGQLDGALIVARSGDGHLYLVDQHRAHERLLYEGLCRVRPFASPHVSEDKVDQPARAADQAGGQLLLEPLVVELTPRQAEILSSRLAELGALGLICEPFGGSTFLVRAVPALPSAAVGATSFAAELAGDAAEDTDQWLDHVRISLACRGAIRRGQPLAPSEQRALLSDLRGVGAPAICPHGSPIILRYTHSYLARAFEW
jgi:DNA mismatch repair protein MutL